MQGLWSIWKREVKYYFSQPAAYILIAVFLVITNMAFIFIFSYYVQQSEAMGQYSSQLPADFTPDSIFKMLFDFDGTVILIMLPFITMRLLSEEKRQKTDELLYTSPISIFDIVGGKFMAALTVLFAMLALTIYLPVWVSRYGELNWMRLMIGYMGVFLMGASFVALGLFVSSLTQSQVVAGLVTFGLFLGLLLVSSLGQVLGQMMDYLTPTMGMAVEGGLKYLSLNDHMTTFLDGTIDTRDLVFYASAIIFGLFLTHRVVESSRWR